MQPGAARGKQKSYHFQILQDAVKRRSVECPVPGCFLLFVYSQACVESPVTTSDSPYLGHIYISNSSSKYSVDQPELSFFFFTLKCCFIPWLSFPNPVPSSQPCDKRERKGKLTYNTTASGSANTLDVPIYGICDSGELSAYHLLHQFERR